MGSPLISLHFTALPPLGWAIYHSTRTCKRARAHTGMYKQMPLSAAHHKPECTLHLEGEQQIICCHCSALHTLWAPVFTADPAHLQRACALFLRRPRLCMYSRLQRTGTSAAAAALMWQQAARTKGTQAGWWKWLVCVNYSSACQPRITTRRNTHNATRVRVNIHVIAAEQLLGRIRSVITGLEIKWEFFISEAACYSANGRRGREEH